MQETNIIYQHLPQIQRLMQKYGVKKAYAFGSAVKGNMRIDSDVDFLISFPANVEVEQYTNNYFSLIDELEVLLGRKVELLAEETLSNPFLIQSIDSHKVPVI